MANRKVDPLKLVRAVVRATHELTSHRTPPFWISVDRVQQKSGIEEAALEGAIRLAVDRGWLITDHHVTSVAVTGTGIDQVERD